MTVPSNYNRRLVKLLGETCAIFAHDPIARKCIKYEDRKGDVAALLGLVRDSFEDASHLEEGTAKASAGHYKRLAREIVQYSILYPDDASDCLENLLFFIEVVAVGRTENFIEEHAAH